MTRSRKSRAKPKMKVMSQAELKKAADLLHIAEQQNLADGQEEIEVILKKRKITMLPQLILRGERQIAMIIFVPVSSDQAQPLPIPQEKSEEEPIQ